jgi:hypothetical protein
MLAVPLQKRARWRRIGLSCAGVVACIAGPAVAQPEGAQEPPKARPASARAAAPAESVLEGTVLGVEEDDIIVDLASKDGISAGDDVELWRPLRLIHPVTRRVVIDRYRIGTVRLSQVQSSISLGRIEGKGLRDPRVGDVVIARRSASAAPLVLQETLGAPSDLLPQSAPNGAVAPAVPSDPEAAAVSTLFDGLRGASLVARIRSYERYAERHPGGRFSRTLAEEAAALRELVGVRQREAQDVPAMRNFAPPAATVDQTPLTITVELSGRPEGAILQARNAGEVAYRPMPMTSAGAGYYTATLPSDRVVPSQLQYFVEAVRPSGESVPVVGTADAPLNITVHPVPHATPALHHETSVQILTDYASYNLKPGVRWLESNDRAWQTEGTFGMRFDDVGVRALRSGFGVYRGLGGSVHDLDELHLDPRSVGLTYGYLEGEFGIKPTVSLLARAVLGLEDTGVSGGGGFGIRLGSDKTTNLLLEGEVLGGIGVRGIIQFQISPRGRFPMAIRSEVTNQPAGSTTSSLATSVRTSTEDGDIGVRGIFQVGYRIFDPLVVSLRASYQGRTISHAGPGGGAAVEYQW